MTAGALGPHQAWPVIRKYIPQRSTTKECIGASYYRAVGNTCPLLFAAVRHFRLIFPFFTYTQGSPTNHHTNPHNQNNVLYPLPTPHPHPSWGTDSCVLGHNCQGFTGLHIQTDERGEANSTHTHLFQVRAKICSAV